MTTGKHILIADQEPGFLFSVAVALRKAGYRVTAVATGQDALFHAARRHEEGETIDLLITDVGMPDLPGAELLFALRRLGVPVPVFVIAEQFDPPLLGELALAGCVGRIEKPFPPEELVRCVERVLRRDAA